MAKVIVMPKLGLTMTEGTLSKWLKHEGEAVKEGEPLFEVETDKLTNTIEAAASIVFVSLSVSTSKRGSPSLTASPSCLSHLLSVPSVMVRPSLGITITLAIY